MKTFPILITSILLVTTIAADIGETTDLSDQLPEVRARLQAAYDTWAAPLPKALWDVERDPAKAPARKPKAKAAQ